MKLAPKLALAMLAGVFFVIAVFTAWRVRGEMQEFDHDIRRDQRIIGLTAAAAVSRTRSQADAMRLVQRIDASREKIQLRFTSLAADAEPAPLVRIPVAEIATPGTCLQIERRLAAGRGPVDHLITYVGSPVSDDPYGAIELAEPLTPRAAYVSRGVVGALASSGAMLLVCGAIVSMIGSRLVGKPVSELIGAARRIGAGDFDAVGAVQRKDELGELARALRTMSIELDGARGRMMAEAEARISALDQLRHAERLVTLGQLASVLAHELGTPLNVISGHAKLIATGKLEGLDARESGGTIGSQCERMTRIVRSILDYARRKAPRRMWIHASDVPRQVYELLGGLAQQRQVQLVVEAGENDACQIFVDPGQLQQALINLVMNAIHASRAGCVVRLGISSAKRTSEARSAEDYTVLFVSDEGHGIHPDAHDRIFEPFFTTKSNGDGTGLGLSVTRDIVREHGGFVEVSSRPDEGSTFRLFLPKRVDDASACAGS